MATNQPAPADVFKAQSLVRLARTSMRHKVRAPSDQPSSRTYWKGLAQAYLFGARVVLNRTYDARLRNLEKRLDALRAPAPVPEAHAQGVAP